MNTKRRRKVLILGAATLFMLFGGGLTKPGNMDAFTSLGTITTYAATQEAVGQSARWQGSGDVWRVSDNSGGFLRNSWFQDDVTQHWYLMGAQDGTVMYSGLITDQSTGKTYLLNTNHDGTYGRMLTADGVYNINGKDIYIQFNQEHDGTYGCITNGLSELRGAGVNESSLSSIPVASSGGGTTTQATNNAATSGNTGGLSTSDSMEKQRQAMEKQKQNPPKSEYRGDRLTGWDSSLAATINMH